MKFLGQRIGFLSLWVLLMTLGTNPSFANSECLLIANGTPIKLDILKSLAPGKTVIALDGAVKTLKNRYQNAVLPDLILGDFDSSGHEDRGHFNEAKQLHNPDPNTTDLEKGILYCLNAKAPIIWIVNALGPKRFDHLLANIDFLKQYSTASTEIKLVGDKEIIEYVENRTIRFEGKTGKAAGIFGAPEGLVTTHGLKYEMKETRVAAGVFRSSSNYLENAEVSITVVGKVLVTYPHRLAPVKH
ncbi:MAG: thiamine diphosphokinase [Bdellovibrio sp.]|nr:thiamine diphosphokinase [Bdellovibrio sp.]